MSGSTAKIVPEINLDEFEKRLRAAGAPQGGAEDPLSELTRLVNMITRESNKGDPVPGPSQARLPKAGGLPLAANDEPTAPFESLPSEASDDAEGRDRRTSPDATAETPPIGAAEGHRLSPRDHAAPSAAGGEAEARVGRPRSWVFKTAGLAAIGLVLLAGAVALKVGVVPGLAKKPPFIAAAEGPNKVQPPSDATVQSGGASGALLLRDSATSAPVKIVSTEEQPVDLGAQTPSPSPTPVAVAAAPAPAVAPTPAAAAGSAPATAVASAPAAAVAASPVAPAADTPIVAPPAVSATVAPLFPEAKPVKTISVRPDGTVISVDSAPAPAPPAPPAPAAKPPTRAIDVSPAATAAAAEPATPKLDLPTKLSPKSSARVVAKTDTTAPAAATDTTPNAPLQLGPPVRSAKPAKAPPAKAAPVVADAAPTDTAAAPAAPAATDNAGAAAGWAVQFAAPRSEADAQSAISRLKSQYADALGGAEIAVRKAEVKGETIYRVRTGGLSKADAAALCAKLKASGGDCFIAKK